MSSISQTNSSTRIFEYSPIPKQQKAFSSYYPVSPFDPCTANIVDLAESYNEFACSYDGQSNYIKKLSTSIQLNSPSKLYASACLPSTARASLLERIARGRINVKKQSFIKLRNDGIFKAPKIVKPISTTMVKCGSQADAKKKDTLVKAPLAKANKVLSEAPHILKPPFSKRKVGTDIFLDNYRQRTPTPPRLEKEVEKFSARYFVAAAKRKAQIRFSSPIKIIGKGVLSKYGAVSKEYKM